MNGKENLKQQMIALFRCGIRGVERANSYEALLPEINYNTLLQAITERARMVYEYHMSSVGVIDHSYYGPLVLPTPATLLYVTPGEPFFNGATFSRCKELWIMPDLTFAVTSCFSAIGDAGAWITEYRKYKGDYLKGGSRFIDHIAVKQNLIDLCKTVRAAPFDKYEL